MWGLFIIESTMKNGGSIEEGMKIRQPFGISMAALTTDGFCNQIISWAKSRSKPRLVTYLNAHCVNIFFRDPEYAKIIRSADLVYADGQSVVWASRLLKESLPERISAGDFLPEFCRRCKDNSLSLYLLGSEKDVAGNAAIALQKKIPGLKIAGVHHGFLSSGGIPEILSGIKTASPDILLVGMGVPLQEKFVEKHKGEINVPVTWCVGALFEYYAGTSPHAPRWMRRAGMEWLFRLAVEPGRLWKRYLLGNARFMLTTLKYLFKNKQK
jgi:N-acetylglucosaminyldiphosphoundecaprenol N-acetyl-beta-D-mannosaminyltransferase